MTTDAVGGVWEQSLRLAGGLVARGDEVALVVIGVPPSPEQKEQAREAKVGLRHVSGPLDWMPQAWQRPQAMSKRLIEEVARSRPDVVHVNGFFPGIARCGRPVLVGAHSTLHGWWRDVRRGTKPPAEWEAYRASVAMALAEAHAVVAPTAHLLAELQEEYGAPPERLVAIANGHDASGGVMAAREERVLWSGRAWDEGKDVALLDKIVAGGLPWPVDATGPLTGPGGERAPVLRHVQVLGRLPTAAYRDRMARASIYVSTSRYEPFGLGALEAADLGCALVLADIPTFREIWGSAAVYAEPRDPQAFRDALLRLMADEALLGEYASRAMRRARAYSVDRMVTAYRRLYDRLLEAPRVVARTAPEVPPSAS